MRDTELTNGMPVPNDRSHTKINPRTGQQEGYVVLTKEEREKGFVRPVRRSYVHIKFAPYNRCGSVTTMAQSIAETYARDPNFYSGTFCCACMAHFPLEEFVWEGTEEKVGS